MQLKNTVQLIQQLYYVQLSNTKNYKSHVKEKKSKNKTKKTARFLDQFKYQKCTGRSTYFYISVFFLQFLFHTEF